MLLYRASGISNFSQGAFRWWGIRYYDLNVEAKWPAVRRPRLAIIAVAALSDAFYWFIIRKLINSSA